MGRLVHTSLGSSYLIARMPLLLHAAPLLLALLCSLLLALLCSLLISLRAASGSNIGSLRRTVLLAT